MRLSLVLALSPLVLAACDPPTSPGPVACDDRHRSLVGSNIGAVTLPQGLIHRIISPGMAVTEDHDPDRLNIHVDDKGWIARVECG